MGNISVLFHFLVGGQPFLSISMTTAKTSNACSFRTNVVDVNSSLVHDCLLTGSVRRTSSKCFDCEGQWTSKQAQWPHICRSCSVLVRFIRIVMSSCSTDLMSTASLRFAPMLYVLLCEERIITTHVQIMRMLNIYFEPWSRNSASAMPFLHRAAIAVPFLVLLHRRKNSAILKGTRVMAYM